VVTVAACSSPQQGGTRGGNTGGQHTVEHPPDGGPAAITCNDKVCDPNATCSGRGSAARCTCTTGYEGDGTSCTDIDECSTGKNDCDKANGVCTNRPGSFLCSCGDGFVGDGKTCKAVSACGSDTNICDPNAVCETDPKTGVACTCKGGFTGDGKSCGDLDECAKNMFSCAANAHCVNTYGAYDCACDAGFTGDGNKACTSLCTAAKADSKVCAPKGLCRVDGSAAVCDACAPGTAGDGKTCTSASCGAQCDGTADDAAHAICNSDGTCACAPGYSGTPGSCSDVNECESKNGGCPANSICANTDGGHTCACNPGFAPDASGACVDVDECKATPSPCHPDATCKNTTPDAKGVGYECTCKAGFTGDGTVCEDVDECKKNNGGCDDTATCINKRGTSSCECTGGLIGDAKGCYCDLSGVWAMRQDVDSCWKNTPIQAGLDENLISAGSVEASVWSISEFVYDGTTLKTRGKGCGADRTPDLSSPYFHETYSSYVPDAVFDQVDMQDGEPWDLPAIVPGAKFVGPSDAAVIGIDLGKDPLHAPWPASHNDVTKWVDLDGDGQPGWTLWPHVPSEKTLTGSGHYSYLPARPGNGNGMFFVDERAGCVSVAARVITHLEGEATDCTHLTGIVINEKSEGRVHSCTRVDPGTCGANKSNCTGWAKDITCNADDWKSQTPCQGDDVDRLDNDQNQVQNTKATFEMVKIGEVGDKKSCDDVKTELPAIKRTVPTITCTTPK
jgi:hypothetical protein